MTLKVTGVLGSGDLDYTLSSNVLGIQSQNHYQMIQVNSARRATWAGRIKPKG